MARARDAGWSRRNANVIDRHWRDIQALRDRNLSYRAIAEAMKHFRDVEFSPEQVAYALSRWGEAPRSEKSRVQCNPFDGAAA